MLYTISPILARGQRVVSSPAAFSTSFTLTTTATSTTYPFTIGLGFREGDVQPGQIQCDLTDYQVKVFRTWNDGSVKHAQIAGRAALTQNVARTVNVTNGTSPTGTALTASDIATAAPSASVQCGAIGSTVNLSSLLASPVRTWVSGSEMVECHYFADVGSQLWVQFIVRLFADGRMWVCAEVGNGHLDNGSGGNTSATTQTYVPTITINGSTVYNNGGASLTHYSRTSYFAEAWIGGDPQVQPLHDIAYLKATKLVPNYAYGPASSGTLNAQTQTYTPMSRGQHLADMGDTGFAAHIGLLPNWEAMYLASGDARAYKATMANALHLRSYAIGFRSKSTQRPIKPSSFGNWNKNGPGAGGSDSTSSAFVWEYNHAPSGGYLAYLLTGDHRHYETMLLTAATFYILPDAGANGNGTSRLLRRQTRGTAWAMRSVGQACALGIDTDLGSTQLVEDYRLLLTSNYNQWKSTIDAAGTMVWSGSVYQFEYGAGGGWGYPNTGSPTGSVAPWMTDFWVQSNGHISDAQPLASMTTLNSVRDWMYRWAVGRLGAMADTAQFGFCQAANYGMKVATSDAGSTWYQDWGTIFSQTFGSTNSSSSNTLVGGNVDNGNGGVDSYWGNLIPAIAYAVEHGASGASAAYARLTGATNWSTITNAFPNIPVFGVAPRS